VLAAAAAMTWCPEGATEVLTDDYRLIRYPDWVLGPSFPAAQITWSRTSRPLDEVIDEVSAHLRSWGLAQLAWWVSPTSAPRDTEDVLRAHGATMINETRIQARVLTTYAPSEPIRDNLTLELVREERTFRDASDLTVRGWMRTAPDQEEFARQLAEVIDSLRRWSAFRVVGYVDGEPAATGGCTLVGEVAELWGAFTLPEYRRRGAYKAVLAESLRLAREHGAELALVKGRVLTLAPILLRSGFADYGRESSYLLRLG
jgi:GNAT superfamily N-acetyltransferase